MMPRRILPALCLLLAQQAIAQNITGTLLGTVRDGSGAAVGQAEVTLTEKNTQIATKVAIDAGGTFQFPYLKPGPYALRVSAPGFKSVMRDNIVIRVDDRISLDLTMEIGEVSTTVSIDEKIPVVETEKGALGQVVAERAVQDLPIQGRNVFDLVGLTAGVQTSPLGEGRVVSSGSATGLAVFNAADISINGGRFRSNEFLIDGISVMTPVQNAFAISPTPDSTLEFKVMTNAFGPQFGRSGGGVVNVVTKGGTSEFHGSVYDFFRNDRLRANNFFANARGQQRGIFHFNMFGGSIGGPVRKNRTFFFADYQGHREGASFGGRSLTIPTVAQKQGDFSDVRSAANRPVIIYDPFTTRNVNGRLVRDAFAGNRIPQTRLDKAAAAMQRYIPDPNRPGDGPARINNWVYAPNETTVSDQWSARVDHRFSDAHSIFFRATRNTGNSFNTGEFNTIADTTSILFTNNTWNAVINGTLVMNPTSVFNYRLGFTRRDGNQITGSNQEVKLTDLGFPAELSARVQKETFPQATFTGYAPIGTPPDAPQTNDVYVAVAEHTLIRGKHTFTYGTDMRLYNQNVFRPSAASGVYGFTRGFTQGPDPQVASLEAGDAFASFLTGYGSGSVQNVPAFAVRNMYAAVYLNDDIRFKNLTVNIGLRWDYEQPRTERYDRLATFDFNRQFPVPVNGIRPLVGVLTHPGRDGQPRGNFDSAWRDFGPRIGLAYRLGNRTVLRSGYGIFYAPRIGYPNPTQFGAAGFQIVTDWLASIDGLTPLNPLSNPYPNGALIPPSSPAELLAVGQAITINPRYNKNDSYTQHWSAGIQREFAGGWLAEAAYTGNTGLRQPMSLDFNQVPAEQMALGQNLLQRVPNPFLGLVRTGTLSAPTVTLNQLLRPFPQYLGMDSNLNHTAFSQYHALQLKGERRFSRGMMILVTYTAGKIIDNGSGRVVTFTPFRPPAQNQYDLRAEKAVSQQDISQRLNVSHTVDLPFGKGRLRGGWSAAGNMTLHTGFPLALTSAGNTGLFTTVLRPVSTGQSAELTGPAQDRLRRYFDTSAFTLPAPFAFGNVSRTLPDTRGPGRRNYNLAVSKRTNVTERVAVLFRAEAFNLTNTPFFLPPGINLGGTDFGVISSATNERQMQFTLRVVF
ncbi:MAG: carboxypeptidase-like regulatory domain-containing protein [Bryobacteraceae bacterium]